MLELNAEERIQLNANGALCRDDQGNETLTRKAAP